MHVMGILQRTRFRYLSAADVAALRYEIKVFDNQFVSRELCEFTLTFLLILNSLTKRCRALSNRVLILSPLPESKNGTEEERRWLTREGLTRIALGRFSPLRGALRASKTLARFVEQGSNPQPAQQKCKRPRMGPFTFWRRERDSNPRYGITVHSLSRRAP